MSSRQLRKLQQQRELEHARLQAEAEEAEEESDDEPVISAPKSKASLFANLAALEDEVKDDDEAEEKVVESQHELSEPEPNPTPAPKAKKSKKNKKAKKKAKEKSVEEGKHENGVDDIDAALRELNIQQVSKPAATTLPTLDPRYERVDKLLSINSQHLKVANEMRNLFGRTAVDNHDGAGGVVRGARRRQRVQNQQVDLETALKGHHSPGKGLSELTLRRNNFIQGKEEWPRGTTGGLTMEMVGTPCEDGTAEFKYVHDQAYQTLQQNFQAFVQMGDPQNLIGLLVRNPYHVSLLIQVSKIAKDQGDHALSSDLLERALFTFGRAATAAFNARLSQGKVRVSFARPENRELWLAGYQYIKSLVMKGTYGTALEWAKLLLSLKPYEDPYAMRLMIHHLAIRAHEFKWLLELYGDTKWAEHWGKITEGQNPAIYHISPSLAFAALQLHEGAKCRELLSDSMSKVPWLFFRLFKELNLDAPPSIWGSEPRTDAETLFTEIYVLQTKDLWNTPEATALLMEIAHTIPKVDLSKIPAVPDSEMTLDVVRFVYLENVPAVMALAPSNLLHRSNNSDSDPLPPDDNIFSYDAQRAALQDTRGMGGNYNNPFAAIGNLLPPVFRDIIQLPRINGEDDNEFNNRVQREVRDLQDMIESGGPDGEGQPPPPGLLQRLLTSMFGGGRGDEDYESEEEYGTDTGDEMPGLIHPNDVDREVGDWDGIDDHTQPSDVNEGDEESNDETPALGATRPR